MMDIDPEIRRLILALRNDNLEKDNGYPAAKALIRMGELALPALIEALQYSWTESVRASAAFALGEIGSIRAVPMLITALEFGAKDEPTTVTEQALKALEKIRTQDALAAVLRWFREHDYAYDDGQGDLEDIDDIADLDDDESAWLL